MKHPYKGHVYGLNTKRGIAILQLAEEPDTPNSLQLTRICDGFLDESYNDDDIHRIVSNKELFFMDMPLRNIKPRSQLYKQFFVFDRPFALPDEMRLPQEQRGFVALNDGTVKWYKKRRGSNYREFVTVLTPEFLQLSPDNCWSLPDLCAFLESGKSIREYI